MASTVIERAASADAAPKEMARSWSTCPARRRVSAFNNAGRPQIASDKAQSQRKGKVAVLALARRKWWEKSNVIFTPRRARARLHNP